MCDRKKLNISIFNDLDGQQKVAISQQHSWRAGGKLNEFIDQLLIKFVQNIPKPYNDVLIITEPFVFGLVH